MKSPKEKSDKVTDFQSETSDVVEPRHTNNNGVPSKFNRDINVSFSMGKEASPIIKCKIPVDISEVEEKDYHEEIPIDYRSAKKKKSPNRTNNFVSELKSDAPEPVKTPILETRDDLIYLDSEIDFSLPKKKKKKKISLVSENITTNERLAVVPESFISDIDDDYSYEYLLARVYEKVREKNPKADDVDKNKLTITPPQILKVGTKKSSFVNFIDLCKKMHRNPAHVQSFLLVELGTNGSINGNSQLIIKGKFEQKQIESVLRKYIKIYVTCHSCHSPNTVLLKETRLYFLKCEACGSQSSVPAIKTGFQAVISKRAVLRTKLH